MGSLVCLTVAIRHFLSAFFYRRCPIEIRIQRSACSMTLHSLIHITLRKLEQVSSPSTLAHDRFRRD